MILIDTSVWIDLLGKSRRASLSPERLREAATCPPIIQEVLQGVRNDLAYTTLRDGFLALPCFSNPVETELWAEATDIYRLGRRKGLTIRSSVDCLIAAIAIRHQLPIWHADRDFTAIARFTALKSKQLRG